MSRIESLGVYQNKSEIQKNKRRNISFATGESNPQPNEEKKSGVSVKKITNVAGIVLGLGAMSAIVLSGKLRPKNVKLAEQQNKSLKKAQDAIANLKDKITVDKSEMNKGFKTGLWFEKVSSQNQELFNNILYGFGTVVIMPLVILFAPFGKKKSTPEDRLAAVMRQPMSFVTMFSMQLTVDKLFKDMVPNFIKKNSFEKNIKDPSDKTIYENIKFNAKEYEPHLKDQLKKVAGFSEEKVTDIFKLGDLKAMKAEIQKSCPKEKLNAVMPKFEKYSEISSRGKLLTQSIIILGNVLFSTPVGCTMLNVLYGKSMKAMHPPKGPDKVKENIEKGGQV